MLFGFLFLFLLIYILKVHSFGISNSYIINVYQSKEKQIKEMKGENQIKVLITIFVNF
jgi:Na+-transporting methylmalonyl-CoA/oxaloacetate decarboxylase gamma subunit